MPPAKKLAILAETNQGPFDLTSFAKRLPKPKSGHGDGSKYEARHKALQKIISCLQHRGELILETLAGLELKVERAPLGEVSTYDPEFEGDIRVLADIPDDWLAGWIQSQTGMAITDAKLAAMLVADPQVLDKLRRFALQLHQQIVLPKSLQVQKLCGRVLGQVSRNLGRPLSGTWTVDNADAQGNISWKKGGCLGVVAFRWLSCTGQLHPRSRFVFEGGLDVGFRRLVPVI